MYPNVLPSYLPPCVSLVPCVLAADQHVQLYQYTNIVYCWTLYTSERTHMWFPQVSRSTQLPVPDIPAEPRATFPTINFSEPPPRLPIPLPAPGRGRKGVRWPLGARILLHPAAAAGPAGRLLRADEQTGGLPIQLARPRRHSWRCWWREVRRASRRETWRASLHSPWPASLATAGMRQPWSNLLESEHLSLFQNIPLIEPFKNLSYISHSRLTRLLCHQVFLNNPSPHQPVLNLSSSSPDSSLLDPLPTYYDMSTSVSGD